MEITSIIFSTPGVEPGKCNSQYKANPDSSDMMYGYKKAFNRPSFYPEKFLINDSMESQRLSQSILLLWPQILHVLMVAEFRKSSYLSPTVLFQHALSFYQGF